MKQPVNLPASVRQRLLDEAKRREESFDYVASVYARERFLARLSASSYRDRLILKGASVFALWLDTHRTTRDLDFLGLGEFGPEEAAVIIREIATTEITDGLVFDPRSIKATPIRERDEYHGVRVHVSARLDTARIPLQIDIGIGDVVTPPAKMAEMPVVLEQFPAPRIKVYPPETIVAEKLHAMVKLGIANSRMKDFFDLHLLATRLEFDGATLATAVTKTFKRRKTAIPVEPFALTEEFYSDSQKASQWRGFIRKSGVDAPADFHEIGLSLRSFLIPLLKFATEGSGEQRLWRSGQWRKR